MSAFSTRQQTSKAVSQGSINKFKGNITKSEVITFPESLSNCLTINFFEHHKEQWYAAMTVTVTKMCFKSCSL
jgi:hypothetical protein